MPKQEPRPAYHRRRDLQRLREYAKTIVPAIAEDLGHAYGIRNLRGELLFSGRYEVVHAYISGWRDAHAEAQLRERVLAAAETAGFVCKTCGQPVKAK